jgi:starvation-inducible DNA-binding protein
MASKKHGNGGRQANRGTTGNGGAKNGGAINGETRGVSRLVQAAVDGTLLYETKNPLPIETRARSVELLNHRLADSLDLQSQCKQAHWNVKGPHFIGLHKLFDEIYEATEEYIDLIAERIVQLGGIAEGTVRVAGARSSLREYPLVISSGDEHVAALSDALGQFSGKAREAIDELEDLEDPDSMDILTEVSRGIDQWLWFVEAHQQTRPVPVEGARSER